MEERNYKLEVSEIFQVIAEDLSDKESSIAMLYALTELLLERDVFSKEEIIEKLEKYKTIILSR